MKIKLSKLGSQKSYEDEDFDYYTEDYSKSYDSDWSEVKQDKQSKKPKKQDYSTQRKNKRNED
jgi:23S rRNA pseudoU1915 N3-methylase RlmH